MDLEKRRKQQQSSSTLKKPMTVDRVLTFPPNETVNMRFRKKKKRNEEPIEIMLKHQIMLCKESTQFLAMTLDSRLNWEEHINKVRAKAKRAFNFIRMVAEKMERRMKTPKNCTVQYAGQ